MTLWPHFSLFGLVWFCLRVYLLHLQDRTTDTLYFLIVPSLQINFTFLVLRSSATQRHSLLWRLIILEKFGKKGSWSIGKQSPSQIMSRKGRLLVQKPFDTYLRKRIPVHPRLRIPTKLTTRKSFSFILFMTYPWYDASQSSSHEWDCTRT